MAGFVSIANEVSFIRGQREHTAYVARLIDNLHTAAGKAGLESQLKILVYGDKGQFHGRTSAIVWLKG